MNPPPAPTAASAAAIENHYRSVDSAPARYAVRRPPSASNGFIVTFVGVTVILMCLLMVLIQTGHAVQRHDVVFLVRDGDVAVGPIRFFVILFFGLYAAYSTGNGWRRLYLGASLIGKFLLVCLLVDLVCRGLGRAGLLELTAFDQQIISALFALAVFPQTVLRQARLPDPVAGPVTPHTPVSAYLVFALCALVAAGGATVLATAFVRAVNVGREWAVLGGVGLGVFLVQQIFALLTAAWGWWVIRRSRRPDFAPDIAVLVPAHNEAHGIAHTINSVDRAAVSYTGRVRLYVVDNASADATHQVAKATLAACTRISGVVLECHEPGKAIALNVGLAEIDEEFICRIDADTIIGEGCIATSMRHFANPRIAAVGGMPLPTEERTLIDKVRLVEVLLRHGLVQIGRAAYQGVLGIPGMFAIYRRSALHEVGGFVQGMNGEDIDICLRMDAAGYHSIADPHAVYYSETPATYAHLREQRTRWFRSIYHITAHNRGVFLDPRSMTGGIVLPLMLANAARRAMLAAILIYAFFADIVYGVVFGGLHWQPVVATVLGMQMIMAAFVCLLWRRPRALLYLPAYLGFRVLRSYFTLMATLSLNYTPLTANDLIPHRRYERAAAEEPPRPGQYTRHATNPAATESFRPPDMA
ncbi:MAG TPA: glycosyltransferase [Aldersonia sp.]